MFSHPHALCTQIHAMMATALLQDKALGLYLSSSAHNNHHCQKPTQAACSGNDHVLDVASLDFILSPRFSVMELAAKKEVSEAVHLSPSTCIKIRSVAKENHLQDLVARCDLFIDAKLPDMLAREDVLSLPRIQVNVKATEGAFELRSDYSIIDEVVTKVVSNLEDDCSSHLEERVIEMYLEDDQITFCPKSVKMGSPEKPEGSLQSLKQLQPSPARKLILDDSLDDEEGPQYSSPPSAWKIVSTHKMSELSAVAVVEFEGSLVLVSVVLSPVVLDSTGLPVSPTTGLCFLNGTNFMAPMSAARSGFGVVSLEGSLLSVGGFNRDGCLSETEFYNFAQNCWTPSSKLTVPRARFGIAKIGGAVFAIGGSDGKKELSSVEMFDTKTQKWEFKESRLLTPRSCFGAATLDGQIYVVGGLHYSTPLKTAEIFNPLSSRWEALPSMSIGRRDVAVTSCLGRVYAIGGQTSGWSCLSSVEVYDPTLRKWSKVPSMKIPRRNAAAVTLNDKIYVIGGYNGTCAVRHVEVFDPLTSTWTQTSSLNVRRSYPAATVVTGDAVYVVGGYANSSFLNSVEKYDLESNMWTPFI